MTTSDDFDKSSNEDEEQANIIMMAYGLFDSKSEYVDEEIEVLFDLSHNEIIIMSIEFLKKVHNVSSKFKYLIKTHSI